MAVPGAGSFNAYGDYTMHAWSGRAQVGYRFGRGNVQFQPFGALEVTRLSLPGYQETAGTSNGKPGALGLAFEDKRLTRTRSFLGTDVAGRTSLPNSAALINTFRGPWGRDFNTPRSMHASFANAPLERFEKTGQARGRGGGM